MRKRTAILISGTGSNMKALIAAAEDHAYPAEIALVFSNEPSAPGLAHAADKGIATLARDHRTADSREVFDHELDAILKAHGIDLIACAGYMRIFSDGFAEKWSGRMINIHPSLLPNYKGLNTHARALADGVKIHGCTVHYVVPALDAGPIIAQAAVPVLPDDDEKSLAARVLESEHRLYPHALSLVASGKIAVSDRPMDIANGYGNVTRLYNPPLTD